MFPQRCYSGGGLYFAGLLSDRRVFRLYGGGCRQTLFAWDGGTGERPAHDPTGAGRDRRFGAALATNCIRIVVGRTMGLLTYVLASCSLGFTDRVHARFAWKPIASLLGSRPKNDFASGSKQLLVLVCIEPDRWRLGIERPRKTFALLLSATLLALTACAVVGHAAGLTICWSGPGSTGLPITFSVCLRPGGEFFRGIVQTALHKC